MEAVFLRHREGHALGPLTREAVEVLWDARIIDESTPVSDDGESFRPVRELSELFEQLQATKLKLDNGDDPWPDKIQVVAKPPATGESEDLDPGTPLSRMIRLGVERAQGLLRMPTAEGEVILAYRDGKIVGVDTTDVNLSFARWAIVNDIVTALQIDEAQTKAQGLDLGGALVASGVLAPNVYFEKLVAWATRTLGKCLLERFRRSSFEATEVPAPAVPLGFDRFGILFEALRVAADRSTLEEKLLRHRGCPLIPSQVEGVTLEDMKPKPRELRALNGINGVATLGKLLDDLGGSDDRSRDVLQAVLFAIEGGFVVYGVDPILEKEEAEAKNLENTFKEMASKSLFELLEVTEKSSDDEVRQRYTDLAKLYHPDGLRQECAPSLRTVRQRIFALISEAAETLETSDQRYQYALDLESGRVGGSVEREKVQAALEAETLFKKAEILIRMKKYAEAIDHIDQAIERAPGEKEFQIFRAYATYLRASRQGEGHEAALAAIKTILSLMKHDANIANGYLYLGYLNKAVDKQEVAARYFKKVLEYDETHPEAVREVRLANARKERTQKRKRWGL